MIARRFSLLGALAGLFGWALLAVAAETPAPPPDAEQGFDGLPPGPGREAVYYTCRACHSDRQFTQQRLSREGWDLLLTEMAEKNGMAEPEPWARTLILNYLATHFGLAEEEDWAGLPVGPGREEIFYLCQACHSLMIVKQQGLSRRSWDESLVWMVEEQGMPDLDRETRDLVLDYLAEHYGPESRQQ